MQTFSLPFLFLQTNSSEVQFYQNYNLKIFLLSIYISTFLVISTKPLTNVAYEMAPVPIPIQLNLNVIYKADQVQRRSNSS